MGGVRTGTAGSTAAGPAGTRRTALTSGPAATGRRSGSNGSGSNGSGEITGRPVNNPGRPSNGNNQNNGNNGNNRNDGNNGNNRDNGNKKNKGNKGNRGHGGCQYPPSGAPQVVMTGPNHTHRGRTVTLNGKVSRNGCAIGSVRLGLYSSHDGATSWVQIRNGQIDAKGNFSFQVPSHALHYYQAVAAAGSGNSMSSSAILKLEIW